MKRFMKSQSSNIWLKRQRDDPYTRKARIEGYRSRAVYKLIFIAQKFSLVKKGFYIVDLGASPGSWSQWLIKQIGDSGKLVAIDILPFKPLANVEFIQSSITNDGLALDIMTRLGGAVQLIVSDCAPVMTGHQTTDQIRAENAAMDSFDLACAIFDMAERLYPQSPQSPQKNQSVKVKNRHFLVKTRQGGAHNLHQKLKQRFRHTDFVKPPASRASSAEIYLLGRDYQAGASRSSGSY